MRKLRRVLWTEEQDQYLREHYPDELTTKVCEALGMGKQQVYRRAQILDIRKSLKFNEAYNFKEATQFVTGKAPWNKGLSYQAMGNSPHYQFKPGRRSHNHKPIGYVRLTKDGYEEVKVRDTGTTRNDYVRRQRIIWEEANGPIPDGNVIVFISGDKTDFRIENLEMLTRQELVQKNSINRFSPELREMIHLVAKVKRRIKKNEEQN